MTTVSFPALLVPSWEQEDNLADHNPLPIFSLRVVSNGQNSETPFPSKLKMLVPSVGPFFTRLPLEAAFEAQDKKRYISSRRFVPPSFNDIRLILNTAQMMAVTSYGKLQLATFDGDVTLYDDGESLEPTSPVIPRILGMY